MGNIGDPITQPIPTVGTAGTSYATQINAFLTEVAARLSAKVSLSSVMAALLDMANNAIKNLAYLALSDVGSPPTTPTSSIQNFAGNMWWVSPAGACQVTNGTSLNAAALSGITGDYGGGNPAQFRYVNTDKEFYAYQDFANGKWAYLGGLGLDIFGGLTSAVKAHITYGGAGSINLVLPPALPGANVIMMLDNSGNITAPATIPVNITWTSGFGPVIQGTANYRHGVKSIAKTLRQQDANVNGGGAATEAAGLAGVTLGANTIAYWPLPPLPTYARIVNVTVYFNSAANRNACTCKLYQTSSADPATTALADTGATFPTSGTALSKAVGINLTPTASQTFWLQVSNTTGGEKVQAMVVDYDVPA